MKLVHISDIHIHDQPILGSEPVANFRACLTHVERFHADADRIAITGDLTHHGTEDSYRLLRAILDASPLSPRLIIGNHDRRETFRSFFPEVPVDENGHVQYVEETPAGRFVFLDTVGEGSHAGHFDAPRRAWLEARLAEARAAGAPAFLFMHHNPSPVGVRSADIIGMVEGKAFRSLLAAYRDPVRHIFFGHCHYVLSGSVAGIPMSAPRSTNHPCVPEFESRQALGFGGLPPTYDVCLIRDDHVAIHSIDFLAEGSYQWAPIPDHEWTDQTGEAG